MSHAANHVDWCIKKAQKEIGEGRMHRGLVEAKPDLKKAAEHIEKAEHNLKAISEFSRIGFSDWSVSAAFYTIYHCFLAILARHGYESRNQECTISAIQHLKQQGKVDVDEKFIESLKSHAESEDRREHSSTEIKDLREEFQYGVGTAYKGNGVGSLLQTCTEMIEIAKEEVYEKQP